ncbi:MAG: hypothetical protein MZV49_18845 [Rhodopseudomonas palustris]|nr:hypothetical protein [Rhodopseudomonas palustris]
MTVVASLAHVRLAGAAASAAQSGSRSDPILDNFPDMPQVACFDTAFHRGAWPARRPLCDSGRCSTDWAYDAMGFHGLSYEYIANSLPRGSARDLARGRVIIAHLGSGASMCALRDGPQLAKAPWVSRRSTVLPMGTRSGQIDPGVVLYLLNEKGIGSPRRPAISL